MATKRSPLISARTSQLRPLVTRVREVDPNLVFGALAALALLVLMVEGRRFSFQGDEWDFLLHRRGHSLAIFLTPHNEHLSALPILAYKTFFQVFGATTTFPSRLLDALLATTCASLVFVFFSRRVGVWVALAAGTVILFFGPGWQDMIWGFQIGYLGSLAAGLAGLLVLERVDRRGDVIAATLFTIALLCSSVGLVILIGAIVEMLIVVYRSRAWQRLWVVALPGVLYALWYSHYGVSRVRLSLIHTVPLSAFDSLSAVAGSLTGLAGFASGPYSVTLDPGSTVAGLLLIALGVRFLRGAPLSARFWGMAATLAAFWSLDAMSYVPGRDPASSKYMYPLACFVLLAVAECCLGWRASRRGLVLLGAVSVLVVLSNLGFLHDAAKVFDFDSTEARAELAAVQVARGVVAPAFSPAEPQVTAIIGNPNVTQIDAGSYFSAIDAFGSQAFSVMALEHQPNGVREDADVVLINAERLALRPTSLPRTGCTRTAPVDGQISLTTGPGTVVLKPTRGSIPTVVVRRFATSYAPPGLGQVAAGAVAGLSLPRDQATLPWQIRLTAADPVIVCGLS